MTTVLKFRRVALAEAVSFLVLLVATYIKHANDSPTGVTIMGPIHGLLFLAYFFLALEVRNTLGWTTKQTALVLLGAVLPFGGFVVERWLTRTQPQT